MIGTVLLAVTLGSYSLSTTVGHGKFGPINAILLLGAAGGLVTFVVRQLQIRSPLIRVQLLKDPRLASGLLGITLVSTIVMTSLVVGPFYLSSVLALSPARVGLVMSIGPILAAVAGVPAGRLVDRIGDRVVALAGLTALGAGCTALALQAATIGVAGYIAAIATITVGYAVFQTANNTAIMRAAPSDSRGVVSGLLSLARNSGLIAGASLMGALFAIQSGSAAATSDNLVAVAHATGVTFAVAAGLAAIAIAASVAANRRS